MSDFTKKHQTEIGEKLVAPRMPVYQVLAALTGRQRIASREDDIIKRMQCRATQGLTESHLYDWDYTLYFDKSMGKVLQSLSTAAQQIAPSGYRIMAKLVHYRSRLDQLFANARYYRRSTDIIEGIDKKRIRVDTTTS